MECSWFFSKNVHRHLHWFARQIPSGTLNELGFQTASRTPRDPWSGQVVRTFCPQEFRISQYPAGRQTFLRLDSAGNGFRQAKGQARVRRARSGPIACKQSCRFSSSSCLPPPPCRSQLYDHERWPKVWESAPLQPSGCECSSNINNIPSTRLCKTGSESCAAHSTQSTRCFLSSNSLLFATRIAHFSPVSLSLSACFAAIQLSGVWV